MLPKEEKIGSNKLVNRLFKQNRGRTLSKPINQPNERSFVNLNNSPDHKYLIPRIAKEKLKPLEL